MSANEKRCFYNDAGFVSQLSNKMSCYIHMCIRSLISCLNGEDETMVYSAPDKKGKGDNLGIIFYIAPLKHML